MTSILLLFFKRPVFCQSRVCSGVCAGLFPGYDPGALSTEVAEMSGQHNSSSNKSSSRLWALELEAGAGLLSPREVMHITAAAFCVSPLASPHLPALSCCSRATASLFWPSSSFTPSEKTSTSMCNKHKVFDLLVTHLLPLRNPVSPMWTNLLSLCNSCSYILVISLMVRPSSLCPLAFDTVWKTTSHVECCGGFLTAVFKSIDPKGMLPNGGYKSRVMIMDQVEAIVLNDNNGSEGSSFSDSGQRWPGGVTSDRSGQSWKVTNGFLYPLIRGRLEWSVVAIKPIRDTAKIQYQSRRCPSSSLSPPSALSVPRWLGSSALLIKK